MTLLCTAGHVDHGKSALVKALTGVDPDRLAEEKRRGMTIELGFVPWRMRNGESVSLIDTPGHQRLIRTMAAGAHAVDGVLLVVAAPEGVMPQTREHLAICQMLGPIPVVGVISMADRVETPVAADRVTEVAELAHEQGADLIGVVVCSALTGEGLDDLASLVQSNLRPATPRFVRGEPRLHVDRAFVMKGHGLVVTGTLIDGSLTDRDVIRIMPDGAEARIRALEHHGETVEQALPGSRTAINLQGLARGAVARGQTLVREGPLRARSLFGARVQLLPGSELGTGALHHVMLHHGTRCCAARLRLLGTRSLFPSTSGYALLESSVPIVAVPGDRFILRTTSADRTLGGGTILDVAPGIRRRAMSRVMENLAQRGDGEPENVILAEVSRRQTGLSIKQICVLTGLDQVRATEAAGRVASAQWAPTSDGNQLVTGDLARRLRATTLEMLREHHAASPSMVGMEIGSLRQAVGHPLAAAFIDALLADGEITTPVAGVVAIGGWAADISRQDELLAWIAGRGLEPTLVTDTHAAGFREDALKSLIADRRVVLLRHAFVARSALDAAARAVLGYLVKHGPAAAGELCRVMSVSRRIGIPVLEHFDSRSITKRLGDQREAGRREREGNDPSGGAASAPPTRFEDGGAHLDPSTPKEDNSRPNRPHETLTRPDAD